MGGYRSGRKNTDQLRPIVENCPSIDILDFKKDGLLDPGMELMLRYAINGLELISVKISVASSSLVLEYEFNEKRRKVELELVQTPCYYGGLRTWLKCPDCSSKRNSLYLGSDGYWACRVCHGLAYKIQRLNPHTRHQYRAQEIKRKQLNVKHEGIFGVPEKPIGMSNKKYIRILDRVITHETLSHTLFMDWVEEIKHRAEKTDGGIS